MANTQMNVRIDEAIKSQGDSVFAGLGLTPSDVVRAVWNYAAEHGEAPGIVAQALKTPAAQIDNLDLQYRVLLADRSHNLVADFRKQLGLSMPDKLEDIDYRSLRESAWEKRFVERGLA